MTLDELHPQNEINLPSRRRHGRARPNWARPRRVKPISELLAERDFAFAVMGDSPSPRVRAEAEAASAALAEARWRAAVEFGVPYGWRPARQSFRLEDLCGFYNSRRRYRGVRHRPHEMFDHPTYFRWERGRGPAGVVAQPYAPAFDLAKAEQFASENELVVHVANVFESWYSPGMCVIVVWERGGPGLSGARRTTGPWTRSVEAG
jgi:hypothetical protein